MPVKNQALSGTVASAPWSALGVLTPIASVVARPGLGGSGGSGGAVSSARVAIFHTDIGHGPKTGGQNGNGAPVTLYGKGFRSVRGTGTVQLNGVAVAAYLAWSDTRITVELGSAVSSGDFTVTNSRGDTVTGCIVKPYLSSVDFTVTAQPIIFIAPSGSNGNGTYASPYVPAQVPANLTAGAIHILRAGTYTAGLGSTTWNNVNIGLTSGKGGTQNAPTTFIGYPGETVQLSGRDAAFSPRWGGNENDLEDWVTLANMTLRGIAQAVGHGGITNGGGEVAKSGTLGMRLIGCDIQCTYAAGTNTQTGMVSIGNDGARFMSCVYHDTGGTSNPQNNNHATYIQIGASDVDVAWNRYFNLTMGYVIQNHTDTRFTYINVRIHGNEIYLGTVGNCRGITLSNRLDDSTAFIYNNVLGPGIGQGVGALCQFSGHAEIYNNTFLDINGPCIYIDSQYMPVIESIIRNNLFRSSGAYVTLNASSNNGGVAYGSNVAISNNLYSGNGSGPGADASAVNAAPQFIDESSRNYALAGTSPARNAGTASVSALASRDKNGVPRPQGGSFDIGALEYVAVTPALGVHALNYHTLGPAFASISTPARDSQETGSVFIVGIGMGEKPTLDAGLPTDNKGNTFAVLGTSQAYTAYPSSGVATYADASGVGGAGHVVTRAKPTNYDEVTLWMVEVEDGDTVQSVQTEVTSGALTQSITTTGPALLVASAWGDAGQGLGDKDFDPNNENPANGWTVVEGIGLDGNLVQCFVAVKFVSGAGTHSITWKATPAQGAILRLSAVQKV